MRRDLGENATTDDNMDRRARACGQTPACFIRQAALGEIPKRTADPLLSELTLIGRRLDHIARLLETGRNTAGA